MADMLAHHEHGMQIVSRMLPFYPINVKYSFPMNIRIGIPVNLHHIVW